MAWDILGDEFCSILVPGLQVFGLRAILHSIGDLHFSTLFLQLVFKGDGVLFVIGVQLCRDLLPQPNFEQFAWSELAVMMVTGNKRSTKLCISAHSMKGKKLLASMHSVLNFFSRFGAISKSLL